MKAFIHSEVIFFTNEGKIYPYGERKMRSSPDGWFAWKP
jgi:hypothetical protein